MPEGAGTVVRIGFFLLVFTAGLLLVYAYLGRIPLLGTLPGDFHIDLPHGSVFLPFGSCALLSAVLGALSYLAIFANQKDRH